MNDNDSPFSVKAFLMTLLGLGIFFGVLAIGELLGRALS